MTSDLVSTSYDGTCAFRLLPTDALVDGPSSATVTCVGAGITLHYAWTHPTDGPQQGALLIGGVDEVGVVEAALFDTWHQQPGLMMLTGERDGDLVALTGTYLEEWGWQVVLDFGGSETTMTMRNVVPESALASLPPGSPPMDAGPYDVMVAEWNLRQEEHVSPPQR